MNLFGRVFWIGLIWLVVSTGWLFFGEAMMHRTHTQQASLHGQVTELWGTSQHQAAPQLAFTWTQERALTYSSLGEETVRIVQDEHEQAVPLASSDIDVSLALDQRRKGLLWFPLYDVGFAATYTYTHDWEFAGTLEVVLHFPDTTGLYDGFYFIVNGAQDPNQQPTDGVMRTSVWVEPGQEIQIDTGYRSRGMAEWVYLPTQGTSSISDFSLTMRTDFGEIDFPSYTMSPSSRTPEGGGWSLSWDFDRIITGQNIGMVMPAQRQPGPLVSQMSSSAPISLGFYFLVIFVLSVLKRIDIHPINYAMVAGAFFSFHLLMGYAADHLPVEAAFVLASATSVFLVVSYLRLVVSDRFAFGPAALAQLVYLVGFGLAHFWEGYTGLTVTVLSILTLFILMQLTGQVDWKAELWRVRQVTVG